MAGRTRRVLRRGWALALASAVTTTGPAHADPAYSVTETREACASNDPLRQPFFGETHVHTAFSFDAASQDTRNEPRDAYRFAKGEELGLQPYDTEGNAGRRVRIDRPLDFAVITDHAEMLGEVRACTRPGTPGHDSDACWTYRMLGPLALLPFATRIMVERNRFAFCGEDAELCMGVARTVWGEIRNAAEEAYDRTSACAFTSFVGYEWTASADNGINLHRNVVFRNEKVPDQPLSWVETPSAYDHWKGLERDCIEGKPGCDVLTIPHNSNISGDGLMFRSARLTSLENSMMAVDAEEARLRQRFEPLIEVMQHKGDSECLLAGDTVDEACGFEKVPYDSFAGVRRLEVAGFEVGAPRRSAFVREALKKGLAQEQEIGVNSLKYGLIAATDSHLGTPGLAMEDRSMGHGGAGISATTSIPPGLPDNAEFNPGGLAVVWAEENSRDAIFSAMTRRETYGTSGTRPIVRFFGGWDYADDLCADGELVSKGYAGGVPMGGDLPARPSGAAAPVFAVSALQDPGTADAPGTPLQRVQIVKGWVEDGETRERVFDVAGGDTGATVDERTCETYGVGSERLCSVWRDPEFEADQHAFYYARVLENPTCRWSQRLCVAGGVDCSDPSSIGPGFEPCCDPDHQPLVRERAWTSPIWYAPG